MGLTVIYVTVKLFPKSTAIKGSSSTPAVSVLVQTWSESDDTASKPVTLVVMLLCHTSATARGRNNTILVTISRKWKQTQKQIQYDCIYFWTTCSWTPITAVPQFQPILWDQDKASINDASGEESCILVFVFAMFFSKYARPIYTFRAISTAEYHATKCVFWVQWNLSVTTTSVITFITCD